jgi:4-hydroxybenzoyl-CoA reductase subunit beta
MSAPLPDFRLLRPLDVQEAVATHRGHAGSRFIAGGTDLLVNVRHGLSKPERLIDLSGIAELAEFSMTKAGVCIGAGVTIAALLRMPAFAGPYRAVAQAANVIAGPGHRAMGTVGGNLCLDTRCVYYNQSEWWRQANGFCLKYNGEVCHVAPQGQHCHAAFTGDLAPALLALGAEVEIAGTQGRRRIPLDDLYVEDGRAHLTLAGDELVVAVHLPPNPPLSSYGKIRVRGAVDYPLAGVAVALAASDGAVSALRIALTGTNSRPFVLAGCDAIIGRPLDDKALRDIERMVQKQVQPMRTTVTSAQYRRLAAAALARRLTANLFSEACAPASVTPLAG